MSWIEVVSGALQGISNFVTTLADVIGGSINPVALEGVIALIGIGIAIRLINDAPKIPGKIVERVRRRLDEDDEYEYIRVRRRS